jgi:hypothetical protein
LAARASQTLKHGSKYHTRKKVVWWLLSVWHYWNWPQRLENGNSQDAISQSRVKQNGVADMEGFVAHFDPQVGHWNSSTVSPSKTRRPMARRFRSAPILRSVPRR